MVKSKTIFKLMKEVLDEAYSSIPGPQKERDEAIRSALAHLSNEYKDLWMKRPDLDYSDPAIRFAYIFRYVTSHANIVYEIIDGNGRLQSCFTGDGVTISCIGGGPGSDFLGVMKYMLHSGVECPLRCYMLDREEAWNECWCDVDAKSEAPFRVSTNFQRIDVTDEKSWRFRTKYLDAALFTMIYFASEVYSVRTEAESFFEALFAGAKPGSRFLFVDNDAAVFSNWFDGLLKAGGVAIVDKGKGTAKMPVEEEKTDLGDHFDKFGMPKLDASIVYRIGEKPH